MEGFDPLERDALQWGREAFGRRMWADAFKAFALADEAESLQAEDRVILAWSAYLVGRHDDFVRAMERAHHEHLRAGAGLASARCAFWLGFVLASRGEIGPATGWFARAGRLVEQEGNDCVERGYVLVPVMMKHALAAAWEDVQSTAVEVDAIGERFADADLTAFARHWQGRALVRTGRVEEGLALLDESMISVTVGELSPAVTGVIYCSMIEACQEIYALQRSQEWTMSLSRWCEGQPDMVPFTGQCLVHRAELMALHGEWKDALDEARRASERTATSNDQLPGAAALYLQGEVHRQLGNLTAAEDAYREAIRRGWDPQPGLALLRLTRGDSEAAAAAIRRRVGEASDALERARLLPAYVEIMRAVGDMDAAAAACDELDDTAARYSSPVLGAMAAAARGAVALAEGDPSAALTSLRHACHVWQQFDAPYEIARVRVLVGLACRALGDNDTAALELDAARSTFERLGAAPDVVRVGALARSGESRDARGLTAREQQVLQLVTAGRTNKAIAAELFVSEKTVDRHVSHILAKLGVSSRVAATAYAYEHHLI